MLMDGRVSLEIVCAFVCVCTRVCACVRARALVRACVPNRGDGGNQISVCGISHCNMKFEKLRSEHARIARERIGPFRYACDAYIDILSNLGYLTRLISRRLLY